MEDEILEKAVEDVRLIKNVIDRSTDSLNRMHKVFIGWGAAFFIIGAACNLLCLLWPGLLDALVNAPFLTIVPKLLMALSSVVIFLVFWRDMQDEGLNRQFMILWLVIFLYSELMPSIVYMLAWPEGVGALMHATMYAYFVPGISMLMIALGMFCIGVFTRVKPFSLIALVCLLLSFVPSLLPRLFADTIAAALLYSLVTPLVLLAAGALLGRRSRQKAALTL
jgi:hypothetical protein